MGWGGGNSQKAPHCEPLTVILRVKDVPLVPHHFSEFSVGGVENAANVQRTNVDRQLVHIRICLYTMCGCKGAYRLTQFQMSWKPC